MYGIVIEFFKVQSKGKVLLILNDTKVLSEFLFFLVYLAETIYQLINRISTVFEFDFIITPLVNIFSQQSQT